MNDADLRIADVLDTAADLITEHGHAKEALQDDCGRLCARGGILAALNGVARWREETEPAFWAADEALTKTVGRAVPHWNNAPERTADEVIQALRDTAVKHRPDAMHSGGAA